MKNDGPVREEKHDTNILKITVSVILLLISFLAEIYVMINEPRNLMFLLLFAIIMVLCASFLVYVAIQMNYQEQIKKEEQYDNIFKSEKASYLLFRSNFEKMNDRLNKMEEEVKLPGDEIVNAQKAIAKVSISRSKENADAIIGSNDQVLNKLYSIEKQINNDLLQNEENLIGHSNKDVLAKEQEILSMIKNVELSIRNEILNLRSSIPASSAPVGEIQIGRAHV